MARKSSVRPEPIRPAMPSTSPRRSSRAARVGSRTPARSRSESNGSPGVRGVARPSSTAEPAIAVTSASFVLSATAPLATR